MYTLVPGGGFILCESIADIDDNAPVPPMAPEVQNKMLEEHCDSDPVAKALSKLGDVYLNVVKPLMSMNYTPGDIQSIVSATETISRAVTIISEKAVPLIAKMQGVLAINDTVYSERYCGDKFYAHIGLFMKSMKRIQQEGLTEYSYTVDMLPMFNGAWRINRIMNILINKPDLLDTFLDQNMLFTLTGFDRDGMEMFDGMIDIMETFFVNTEKLARLEKHQDKTLYIVNLFESLGSPVDWTISPCRDMNMSPVSLLQYISQVTRKTLQEMYEIQTNMIDGKTDVDLSKVIYRVVNLYGVITLHTLFMAYQLRRNCAWASAVNRYTDLLLNTLKAG